MISLKSVIRALPALLLGASLLSVPAPASAAPMQGPLLVRGVVSDGAAASGATATVWWTEGGMSGRSGLLYPEIVATATADQNGRFRLGLRPSAEMLAEMSSRDGWLNLELAVRTNQNIQTSWSFSRQWTGDAWARFTDRPEQTNDRDVRVAIKRDFAGNPTEASHRVSAEQLAAEQLAAGRPVEPNPPVARCVFSNDYTTNDSTRIMSFHNASQGEGRWEYGSTADSDIDVGVDAHGNGGWFVSGSKHMSNTSSGTVSGVTNFNYDSYVRTSFRYQHRTILSNYCWQPIHSKVVYAISWSGGVSDDGKYPGTSCAFHRYNEEMPVNTGFSKNTSRASRISFAVGIGPARLGQTSGHSTNVDMSWKALRGNGLWYCGAIGDPGATPGVIYVSNRG